MTAGIQNAELRARLEALPKRNLGGLMRLYESSYQRLMRLLPEWPLPFEAAQSQVAQDHTLHVTSVERCPYTATIRLYYLFGEDRQPDLLIKVYHDAQLAEAISVGNYHRCEVLREFDFEAESAVHNLWPANLLMDKWLSYLLQQGHGFALVGRPRNEQSG